MYKQGSCNCDNAQNFISWQGEYANNINCDSNTS